ncbi:iron complex outermembrane receptor protein [Volucribacter psittacicida]|uniref:Iron complex outermembrane receptor protein n=1 Tax=Volucribacter psittacicida TaxID=203482 RepID=A0A4R1FXI2_9PAST|nr:TonB-dependent siderophore receptor [Volucribacter psittacicida]TCJ98940.1 iron complex outermembrane receptor protein [Volucribacter psittacicida]
MNKFSFNLIYLSLFAGISFPTFAETNQVGDSTPNTQRVSELEKDDQLDEITVSENAFDTGLQQNGYQVTGTSIMSKADVPILDTPTTVNVVSKQLLQDRQPTELIDALSSVSGVSQANTLGGIFDSIQKRGFGGNRDNSIMRNGIQAGPSHNFGPTTDTVEVLKGPASVLYGIQDPGGVINVITKKPLNQPRYVLSGTVGNHNMWGTQLDLTGPLGNGFSYRFIYDKNKKDYWRNFGQFKNTTYAPSLAWENENTKVLVAYEHLDYKQPFDRGANLLTSTGQLPDIPIERRLDEPYDVTSGKTDNIQVKIQHRLNDNWKLNVDYGYARAIYDYNQARITQINTTTRTARRTIEAIRDADQRVHSGSINTVGEFAIGNIANRVVIGVDATRNYRNLKRYQNSGTSSIDIDNPIYTDPTITYTVASNTNQTNNVKTVGVYLQDTAYLTDKLIVTGGLRYEYFDQLAGRGLPLTVNTDQHGGKLLYQLGSVYKFTPNWTVYGNYAESFRPQYSIAASVNSSLKPEEGKSFEIGSKYENAYLSATLALFNIDKKNVGETRNNVLYIVGKQRSRGVELDIDGQLTDNLSASLSYTYTRAKTLENDEYPLAVNSQISGVPEHQAALFLGYNLGEFSFGSIRLGGGARYLGSWNAYNSDYSSTYKIPHAVVADAFINYATKIAGKNVSFQLNGKNLFNKTYYPSTSGDATDYVIPVAVGYKREVFLTAKLEF